MTLNAPAPAPAASRVDPLAGFLAAADATPDRIAVRGTDGALTFAALARRSEALAGALRAHGVGRGDRVGIHLPRTTDLLVALLAVWRTGAAYVPLDPAYPRERLAFMAQDADIALLLTSGQHAVPLAADVPVLTPDAAGAAAPDAPVTAADAAYVIYTSGSTGIPKGVEATRGGVAALLAGLSGLAMYRAEPAVVGWSASVSFDASVQQWARVCRGDEVVVIDEATRTDPARLVALLDEHGVSDLDLTPSHWELLRESFADRRVRLFMGGEPVPARVWDEIGTGGIDALNLYGPTECTVDSTATRITGPAPHLGAPLPGVGVHLLDERLCPVEAGATGELYIEGPGVAHGYVRRPGLTAERFVASPFTPGARLYRTGDLARYGTDGTLLFGGRADRQVKLRGFRVEPGEIEAALARHPGVSTAAVAVHRTEHGDQQLVGYVTTTGDRAADGDAVLAHARTALPAHMVPAAVLVLDALPLTPNGKVDYDALAALRSSARPAAPARSVQEAQPAQTAQTASSASPADSMPASDPQDSALAEQVAEVWRTVLVRDDIRPEDDFLSLGGHSLAALRVTHVLRRRLGIELQLRHLLDSRDLADFTETVRRATSADAPRRPALVGGGAGAR
ncbi:non-ribosomal peptide synthetase [Streptomyces sp. NPDC006632]|uniref:non-ribosomal peptide synthetase n=1 Tax=Streptomyces sp. NPDC006632 TaxID=3157182 RepID=UPI0033AA9A38